MTDTAFTYLIEELGGGGEIEKSGMYLLEETDQLQPGSYFLLEDHFIPKTGERLAKAGSEVIVENGDSIYDYAGVLVFEALHVKSKRKIFVTQYSLTR